MASMMDSVNAVYAKWDRAPNGNSFSPSKQQYSADNVLANGKNAWRSKFKQLPPQPERRKTAKSATRRARSAVQPVSKLSCLPFRLIIL